MGVKHIQYILYGYKLDYSSVDYDDIPTDFLDPKTDEIGVLYDGRSGKACFIGKVIDLAESPSPSFSKMWTADNITISSDEESVVEDLADKMNVSISSEKPNLHIFTFVV